jgi:hypothetical protein
MLEHSDKNVMSPDVIYPVLNENASLIIFSAETEYISTRYWYLNINMVKQRYSGRRGYNPC